MIKVLCKALKRQNEPHEDFTEQKGGLGHE